MNRYLQDKRKKPTMLSLKLYEKILVAWSYIPGEVLYVAQPETK